MQPAEGARLPGNAPTRRTADIRPLQLQIVMRSAGGRHAEEELASNEYGILPVVTSAIRVTCRRGKPYLRSYLAPGHGVMSVCSCEAGRFSPMAYPRPARQGGYDSSGRTS